MRIVFLAVDDEFAGRMQSPVYESIPGSVVGSVISTVPIYKRSRVGAAFFVLRRSGVRFAIEMFRMKILRKVTGLPTHAIPSELATQHGVPMFRTANINDQKSIAQLEAWAPDLIISTNFSHYLGKRVREVARIATWNLHKSYLPNYRGMAPSFYALLDGASHSGATLHEVAEGIDSGAIVTQVEVPIRKDDTVYTLNVRSSDSGGHMLAELLQGNDPDCFNATPQAAGSWRSFSYPSRAHVSAFLRKGLRF